MPRRIEGAAAASPVLRMQGISKRFGALVANADISLELAAGEVLGLLGENGAGKSTLVSILFGHYAPDAGRIEVSGRELALGQPRAALAAGIGMVHQHFTLADNLSVLDNVMLGTEPLWRPSSRRRPARARLLEVARRFGLSVDPDALVATLSVGERQRVEILKALYRGARILILDEPTAVLTPQESEALFRTLDDMVAQGLAIVFISHKLAEVLRVAQRVVVLRAGRVVARAATRDTDAATLARWMVGQEVALPQVRHRTAPQGPAACSLADVHAGSGREQLHGVNLALRGGEITAIAGVSGNGQRTLADLLCGVQSARSGRVELPASRIARVPEDRHGTGVIGDLPVGENAVSEPLRLPAFRRGPLVGRQGPPAHPPPPR